MVMDGIYGMYGYGWYRYYEQLCMVCVVNQCVPLFTSDNKSLAIKLGSDYFCSILVTVKILLI